MIPSVFMIDSGHCFIMKEKIGLSLYIIGNTPRSERAITQLKQIMDRHFKGMYDLFVINLLDEPDLAEKNNIMVTPTVVRETPLPIQRIVGEFMDEEKVLWGLDLNV